MAYKTLKKIRILRYGRWVEVDKDHQLTEKEVDECPNLKAWIRWGLLKEVPDSKKKQESKTLSTKRSTRRTRKSKATEPTSGAKTETKPEDTTKLK